MRRRCVVCRKLTENWQRVNGGSWYCYDGCYSTTGYDRRSINGKPLWEDGIAWPQWREATEKAGTACIGPW